MLENRLADLQQAALDLLTGNQESDAWEQMQEKGATIEEALAYINATQRQLLASKKAMGCS